MCTIDTNIHFMLPAKYAARTYTFTGRNPAVLAMDHMEQEEVGRIEPMTMNQEERMNQGKKKKKSKVFPPVTPPRSPPLAVCRIKAMAMQGEKRKMQALPCFTFWRMTAPSRERSFNFSRPKSRAEREQAAMAAAEALRDCTAALCPAPPLPHPHPPPLPPCRRRRRSRPPLPG
jgi:hypothetical protein